MPFRHLLPLALFLCVSTTARGAAPIFLKGVIKMDAIDINATDVPDNMESPPKFAIELPDTPLTGLHNKTLRSRMRRDVASHNPLIRPESHYAELPSIRPESHYAEPANTTTHNEGFVGKLSSMIQHIANDTEEDIITAQRLALVKQAVELVRLALSEATQSPP